MSSARKKVIVRRFTPGLLRGYLASHGFVQRRENDAVLQMLDLAGRSLDIPLHDIKQVSYVREFYVSDEVNPERLPRRSFLARPRTEGLWVRLALRDDDPIEGLASLDLSLADSLADDLGLHLIPPDVRGNTQRLYIPRAAMETLQVVAVVTSPARRKALSAPGHRATGREEQRALFPAEPQSSSAPPQ